MHFWRETETHTPNDEYENFINAHLEAAAECIPNKQRAKSRVPWETAVRKKRADVKTASKCNRKNPTNTNALKLENELANIYLKEQTEYIQNQIDKIRDSVERKIKNKKAAGCDEIAPEVWKTRQFDDIQLWHCNAVYTQNTIDR